VRPDRGVSTTKDGLTHAVLWQDGKIIDLGKHAGYQYSAAVAINDRGQVIGNTSSGKPSSATWRSRAFLWQNGKRIDLGTLHGDPNSSARAINNLGQIVGNSDSRAVPVGMHGDAYTRAHGFIWQNGNLTELGTSRGRWSEIADTTGRSRLRAAIDGGPPGGLSPT